MGIIVRNMSNFSHVRLGRPPEVGRPTDIETYGEVFIDNTTWGYLIPLQSRYTQHPTIPGVTLTYPANWVSGTNYRIGALLNRTRVSEHDGFVAAYSRANMSIVFTFHEPFYMDAYFIQGLRNQTGWKPGGHAVEIMFLGDDFLYNHSY